MDHNSLFLIKELQNHLLLKDMKPKYQINVNTMEHVASKTLKLNEIGIANLTTDRSIPFTPMRKTEA